MSTATPHTKVLRAPLALSLFALALGLHGCRGDSGAGGTRAGGARAERSARQGATAAAPEVKVYVDEARLQRPFAVLGGTVENAGGERLERLSVEVELRHRADGRKETREVPVVPQVLGPGEKGSYSLKVKSEEWGGFRVVRLRAPDREGEVAFQSLPGRERPPERVDVTRTTTEQGPARRPPSGDDFINTPDTPISVP